MFYFKEYSNHDFVTSNDFFIHCVVTSSVRLGGWLEPTLMGEQSGANREATIPTTVLDTFRLYRNTRTDGKRNYRFIIVLFYPLCRLFECPPRRMTRVHLGGQKEGANREATIPTTVLDTFRLHRNTRTDGKRNYRFIIVLFYPLCRHFECPPRRMTRVHLGGRTERS